jgi:CheY-like chemotaxis protein
MIGWKEDGAPLERSGQGGFVQWRELKKSVPARARPVTSSLPQGQRLLLVDDEPDMLVVLVDTLTLLLDRPQIATARDGRAALRKLETLRPDLLITDLEMPGMGGLELCRWVRQNRSLAKTKILVVTGCDSSPRHRAALDGGADCYLVKPFEVSELRAEVVRLLAAP